MYSATTVEEWTAVLNLAAMWKFESIKAFSIERLANLASPIDKIVLGRKHNVVEWLSGAYREVCERDGALTLEEAHRLGMEDVVRISSLRQDIRGSSMAFGSGLLLSVGSIRKRFELEGLDPLVSSNECNGKAETEIWGPPSEGSDFHSLQELITGANDNSDDDIPPPSLTTGWANSFAQASEPPPLSSPVGRGSVVRGRRAIRARR